MRHGWWSLACDGHARLRARHRPGSEARHLERGSSAHHTVNRVPGITVVHVLLGKDQITRSVLGICHLRDCSAEDGLASHHVLDELITEALSDVRLSALRAAIGGVPIIASISHLILEQNTGVGRCSGVQCRLRWALHTIAPLFTVHVAVRGAITMEIIDAIHTGTGGAGIDRRAIVNVVARSRQGGSVDALLKARTTLAMVVISVDTGGPRIIHAAALSAVHLVATAIVDVGAVHDTREGAIGLASHFVSCAGLRRAGGGKTSLAR
mmetsp:Transcript_15888/g.36331  ORF Transcript_15888/g.36331 Transcript_15888/m.36331 type:complete len:267 (-) Transcript_15888:1469-2269(-)